MPLKNTRTMMKFSQPLSRDQRFWRRLYRVLWPSSSESIRVPYHSIVHLMYKQKRFCQIEPFIMILRRTMHVMTDSNSSPWTFAEPLRPRSGELPGSTAGKEQSEPQFSMNLESRRFRGSAGIWRVSTVRSLHGSPFEFRSRRLMFSDRRSS